MTLLLKHGHQSGVFDPGHCWVCAREAGLQHHFRQVQREEQTLREAHGWAWNARRYALYGLWSSGIAILLAAIALLTG